MQEMKNMEKNSNIEMITGDPKKAINKLSLPIIASMFLAFGGISVHIQVLSQIVDTDIKYHYFLVGRIYQMVIAGILTFLSTLLLGI